MNNLQSATSNIKSIAIAAAVTFGILLAMPVITKAAPVSGVTSPAAAASITFSFDDGLSSTLTAAAPAMAKYGITGTDYVTTGCVGMTKKNNTCHANTATTYMTWAQIQTLKTTYGWEIGSHTATHPYLATSDATDGQPNVLTPDQVVAELVNSNTALSTNGYAATAFASPYGDYNMPVLAQIAKVYGSHRGFADQRANDWPYNDYLINDFPVQAGVTVAQVKAKIDAAIANKQWLVLTFHDIKAKASTDPDDYEYNTADLSQIAAYVQTKQKAGLIQQKSIGQTLVSSTTNLLPNASFNSGLSAGWTTDNPAAVTADAGNNGNYPDAKNAIKFTANGAPARLYSPRVTVNSNTTYVLKNYLNVQANPGGSVEFYIDEYDAAGNWISGQYKRAESSVYVESFNFAYTPSSAAVTSADLQVTVTANSGITAYFDNAQWFPVSTTAITQTNLLANGTFETGLTGWTTDNASVFTADTTSNGSPNNPTGSAKVVSNTGNAHLFSSKVSVSSAKSYTLTNYLNIKATSGGQVAFYIDEYDAAGNWISGQYKMGLSTLGAQTVGMAYKPSSANVASASLQVIATGPVGTTAYFDDALWYAN